MTGMKGQRCARGFGAAVAALATLSPAGARAEPSSFMVPLEASFSQWTAPALSLNGDDASGRLVGLSVPSAARLYGVSAAVSMLIYDDDVDDKEWTFAGGSLDFLRARFAWSERSAPVSETVGGAPVTVTGGPEHLLEMSAPFLTGGLLLAHGHFLARANVDWGWAYLWSQGIVQPRSGPASTSSADAGSFFARVPLAVCVLARSFGAKKGPFRVGEDACITFTPNIYEWAWFNGWSAGVRVDL
jgi:hypothetical protein